MKHIFVVSFLFMLFCCKTARPVASTLPNLRTVSQFRNQDTTLIDTLGYLKGIVTNKQKYINRPLSILLNDLQIPIKAYSFKQNAMKTSSMVSIAVYFNYLDTAMSQINQDYKNFAGLSIVWASNVSMRDAEMNLQAARGDWTVAQQNYFGREIVADIVPLWVTENDK